MKAILILLFLVGIFWTHMSSIDDNSAPDRYGFEYNQIRVRYKIPIIESHWKALERESTHIHWTHRERRVYTVEPFHLYKTIFIKSDTITHEEDAFHYETEGDKAYRLMIMTYIDGRTNKPDSVKHRLITYFKGQYEASKSQAISQSKSDSLLNEWTKLKHVK